MSKTPLEKVLESGREQQDNTKSENLQESPVIKPTKAVQPSKSSVSKPSMSQETGAVRDSFAPKGDKTMKNSKLPPIDPNKGNTGRTSMSSKMKRRAN